MELVNWWPTGYEEIVSESVTGRVVAQQRAQVAREDLRAEGTTVNGCSRVGSVTSSRAGYVVACRVKPGTVPV
jgi:hypothetical protein